MADIKISNLESTNSLNNFYVPGTEGTNSKKFNLSGFENSLESSTNSIQYGIGEFNSNKNYYVGEYVVYNSSVYRFTSNHHDEWDISDVQRVSVFSELESLTSFVYETVYIYVGFNDNLLQAEGTIVTVRLEDGTELQETCDSNGNCIFEDNIPKDNEYTILLPDKPGYQHFPNKTLKANTNVKYINLIYQKSLQTETCTIKINFSIKNIYNLGNISDFNGLSCSLNYGNNQSSTSTIDSSGVATFSNMTKGIEYITSIPNVIGYVKPEDRTFIAYDNNSEINVEYNYIQSSGAYLVYTYTDGDNNIYSEINLNELYDGNTWIGGTWLEDTGIASSNIIALHINPDSLASIGYDYYVRINDIIATDLETGAWSSDNVEYETVPSTINNNYDGRSYTFKIVEESISKGLNSSAANYASNQSLQINDRILHGFIGSASQLTYLVDPSSDYRNIISSTLSNLLGSTESFNDKNLWTSIQNGTKAVIWNDTSETFDSSSENKTSTSPGILPFFSL